MSFNQDDIQSDMRPDRRISVRRKEDYFWLQRLADVTDEACLIVNQNMSIDYMDDKLIDLLKISPNQAESIEDFGGLISLMAEQGYFGRGNPKMFEALISDLLVNQRLKQKTATQIINAVTPGGQHIDIRVSLGRDNGFLILMRDNTKEELQKRALDTALKVGKSGYWFYNLRSGEFQLRADSLKEHFSHETFRRIQNEGFMLVIHPEDKAKVKNAMEESIATAQSVGISVRVVDDSDAVHWLQSHIMPYVDESGKVRSLACFFTNITDEILVQKDLQSAQGQAEQAQQKAELALKAKNEFLGRLSHEVRTPMNAVVGMADALVHNCKDPDVLPKLSLIQKSAERVVDMVDETLQHTKLADHAVELNLEKGSPGELVKRVCETWEIRAADNQTRISYTIHNSVPETIMFDELRYEQCLSNLLSNAIKFSQGGNIQVVLTVAGQGDQRQLVLAVRDTGIGMDKDALSQIFLPYKQADKSISSRFGGTGLGLSIVKDLVELMGGRISVSSEPGEGSLFAIRLPLENEHEPTVDIANPLIDRMMQPEEPEKQGPYARMRVLIVDDNATNHVVVSSLLDSVVAEIDTALNGEEALAKLDEKPFDLVLMDIHMPVMDGIETTLAIRSGERAYTDIPIIALTADPQYQQARLCRNIGMNSSLAKPIKLAGLLKAFDEVLGKQSVSAA